ncbi:MAG: hypothetical protein DRJ03_01320 [Chloroflexi bacterium]|nr:MAG: hypothetical protein DRJ03_01320 [Chloroflexota bacterium]
MANYSTDPDLVKIRPNILELGVASWNTQHTEAKAQIDRILESRWYNEVAAEHSINFRSTPFDADKCDAAQLVRVACYKTLELAYLFLMKDSPEPDGYEREMKLFGKMYKEELNLILSLGVNYDWDDSDTIEDDERLLPRYRRTQRV